MQSKRRAIPDAGPEWTATSGTLAFQPTKRRGSAMAVHQSDELKFILDSAKGGSTRRKIKTAKLPTSLEERKELDRRLSTERSFERDNPSDK